MVHRIALIRHGESVWNLENIFTGWTDVDLSETGKKEARQVLFNPCCTRAGIARFRSIVEHGNS